MIFKNQKDRVLTYQRVFNTDDGRKVILDLYRSFMSNDPIGADEMGTFILVGQQTVIREIMRIIALDHMKLEEELMSYVEGE